MDPTGEDEPPPVEDELAARRRAVAGLRVIELVPTEPTDEDDYAGPASVDDLDARSAVKWAEDELAAAESAHWQAEFDLADAEGAMEAASDRVDSLDTQRIEARRDKVTAQRYLTQAKSRQRDAVKEGAEARRRLDAARREADRDG